MKERDMQRSRSWLARISSLLVGFVIISSILIAAPAPRALADGHETTLFRAEFDSAPLGPISNPLDVETGSVVPQEGLVTVAHGLSGRALKLQSSSGPATALVQ